MRKLATFGAVLAIGATLATAVQAKIVCIEPRQIDHTKVVSPRTILFHMKNGEVLRSDLATPCLGLRVYGFAYVGHDDELCSGAQAIHVLNTHETCTLGPFQREMPGHS